MPDLTLDMRYLRYAILVAEHGSFRAAAESLNLSQTTVSRRVQLLERRLGFVLFKRHPKGARLTEIGERFLRSAATGVSHLRQAVIDTRKAHQGETGRLRIAVMTSLASGFLSDLLDGYHAAYPSVEICLEEVSAGHAAASALGKTLDIAFLVNVDSWAGRKSLKLWSERVVVALPRDHRLAEETQLDWSDLRSERLLVLLDEQGAEAECLLLRASGGISRPDVSFHRLGRDDMLHLVAKGFGVFVTPQSTARDDYKNVLFVPLGDEKSTLEFSAVWSSESGNPAILPFVQFASDLGKLRRDDYCAAPSRKQGQPIQLGDKSSDEVPEAVGQRRPLN